MESRRLILFLATFTPLTLGGCIAADDPLDDDDGHAVGTTEDPLGEAQTVGFVSITAKPAEQATLFAAEYAHLDPTRVVPDNLLYEAVAYFDKNEARLQNKAWMAVVDFAPHSGKKRFFMIDMQTGAVSAHAVAHGAGSETTTSGMATKFSDTNGSHMSSLGYVVTGEVFTAPRHGRSLLLYGLSQSNAHMRPREIIIHGAAYVNDETTTRQGNSWGCFALDLDIKDAIITKLRDGALIYANLGKPNVGDRAAPAPDAAR